MWVGGGRNLYSNVGWGKHYSEWLSIPRCYIAPLLLTGDARRTEEMKTSTPIGRPQVESAKTLRCGVDGEKEKIGGRCCVVGSLGRSGPGEIRRDTYRFPDGRHTDAGGRLDISYPLLERGNTVLLLCPAPWILKRGGLESFGQWLISSIGKIKGIAFLFYFCQQFFKF